MNQTIGYMPPTTTGDFEQQDPIFQIVGYGPGMICCPVCGEWYDRAFWSSDPSYQVHTCSKQAIEKEINRLQQLLC